MNKKPVSKLAAIFLSLCLLSAAAYANTDSSPSPRDQLYTNAGALIGTMNAPSTTFTIVGMDGSYGFNKLFPDEDNFLQHLFAAGSILVGADSGNNVNIGLMTIGVGAHYEFEPTSNNIDLGNISAFAMLLEQATSITVDMPTYTINGQTYGGGSTTYSDNNGAIEYGIKWLVLNAYEWDFYGVNGHNSTSSGTQSAPIGGNSLNLQFKWLMEPKANSAYLGIYFSSQDQGGTTSNMTMLIGGYVW